MTITAIATEPIPPPRGGIGDWIRRWVADHRRPTWQERLADELDAELARWRAVPR